MKQKKKSRFFTFIFSFMPGAAEMYMGFMRQGLSLMALFLLALSVQSALGHTSFFILVATLIWFYSFFHARNLRACEEEEFQKLEDDFIWTSVLREKDIQISNPVVRKIVSWALLIGGAVLLWENMSKLLYRWIPDALWDQMYYFVDAVPEIAVAVLIIYIGVRMIKGKKEELDGDNK